MLNLRPQRKEKLLQFVKNLRYANQKRIAAIQSEKEALKRQRQISAAAKRQERESRAAQKTEFRARQKQLAMQKRELLRAELLLAAKQKSEKIASERKQKEEEKHLKKFAEKISDSVGKLGKSTGGLLSSTVAVVSGTVKKARAIKVPSPESFAAVEIVPAGKIVKVVPAAERPKKYREPIKLGPFLRKNAFRFLFVLLLLMWFGEILYYTMRWRPPREKFEEMYGTVEKEKVKSPAPTQTASLPEQEYRVPSVNIEGKRDPFSSGSLTMELMRKPRPTEIARAYQPGIITIRKTPILITPTVSRPVREKFEKISSILKPEKPEVTTATMSEVTTSKVLPPQTVTKPEISPLITPQIECPLVYRGSLIMEGIEYIFIEGKYRTYRVTVGDVVEGFRILKKEKGVLTLSKDGTIIEIPAE